MENPGELGRAQVVLGEELSARGADKKGGHPEARAWLWVRRNTATRPLEVRREPEIRRPDFLHLRKRWWEMGVEGIASCLGELSGLSTGSGANKAGQGL